MWNIVLSGYPGSGKTVLARRLVSENPRFVRVSVDDVRSMFYGTSEPTVDDEFVYNCLASLRDFVLRTGYNVILDTTAPQNRTREFLLRTRVEDVLGLLVVMIVSKTEVDRRNQERKLIGAREAWDQTWEEPSKRMPVMKFRNENQVSFETSYYLLAELLEADISPYPYRKRFLDHMFPRIRASKPTIRTSIVARTQVGKVSRKGTQKT